MQAFSGCLLVTHGVVAATLCSPVSWDVLLAYCLLVRHSLVELVQPMDNLDSEVAQSMMDQSQMAAGSSGIRATTSQKIMLRAGLFCASFMYAATHVPLDPQAYKAQIFLALSCLDSLLLFGHLWDRVPSLQVVLNCRFTYVCLLAVLNACVFLAWRDCCSVPFRVQAAHAANVNGTA